ncbi:hypothetical protein H0264_14530 [Nocardia huaxiensis]|uniref:Uncharacterized protein n=1 Tax=Nocardia huaxiensis TaxID=2755382 RepID=A0A7D6Z723_9NOCA|nr:hypothetical protein [Nocardia huaxiensis]QLY33284.1 hypothetical protein H0264_14530 [Nocardia huaxiensis]
MTRPHPDPRLCWTDRDGLLTRFTSQQWCIDFATLQLLCGTGRSRTYELLARLRSGFGVLRSVSIFPDNADREVTVVWPWPAVAAEQLGHAVSSWNPTRTNIVHKLAVARARAALCGLDPQLWVPERKLLRDAAIATGQRPGGLTIVDQSGLLPQPSSGLARGHVHDGRYLYRDSWLSVEVELTLKRPSRKRLVHTVFNAYQRARTIGDGLLYLYETDVIGNALDRAVTELITTGRIPEHPDIRLRSLQRVIQDRSIDLPAPTIREERAS